MSSSSPRESGLFPIPNWKPDSEAPTCMSCGAPFNLINRRHHCRQCGDIFCGKCSSEQSVVPTVSEKPVRVCACCFDMIKIQNILSKVHQINQLKNTSLTAPDLSTTLLSLSKFDINQEKMIRQGVLQHLLVLSRFSNKSVLCNIADTLINLTSNVKLQNEIIAFEGLGELLLTLLSYDDIDVQTTACIPLSNLASNEKLVTNLISVLPTLITLVQDVNSTKAQLKIASALVPFAVSSKFIDEGGLNPVITLALAERTDCQLIASKILVNLVTNKYNRTAVVTKGGLLPLISLLTSDHSEVQLNAVIALYKLCEDDTIHSSHSYSLQSNSGTGCDSYQIKIKIVKQGALQPLISIIHNKDRDALIVGNCLKTINRLLTAVENQLIALKYKEFVETILQLAKKQDPEVLIALLGVISTLSQNGELKETLLSNGIIQSMTPLTHSADAQVVCTACTVLSKYPNLNI